jgi:adenylate kinase family enzyme
LPSDQARAGTARSVLDQGVQVVLGELVAPVEERELDDEAAPDDFPAEALDELLRELGRDLDVVFEFQLADAVGVERMLKRAAEEGRADDTPEAIRTRLVLYNEQTAPLVEYYRSRGHLVGIHADRAINEVFAEIQDALDQVRTA